RISINCLRRGRQNALADGRRRAVKAGTLAWTLEVGGAERIDFNRPPLVNALDMRIIPRNQRVCLKLVGPANVRDHLILLPQHGSIPSCTRMRVTECGWA